MNERYALSPQQRQLWQLAKLRGPLPSAHCRFRIEGKALPDAVHAGIAALVARHESLRTVFNLDGEAPWQEARRVGMHETVSADGRVAFDLCAGPVIRVAIEDESEALTVTITVPALTADQVGLQVLVSELHAVLTRGIDSLGPIKVQALDAAAFFEDQLNSNAATPGRQYWAARRIGPEALSVPWRRSSRAGGNVSIVHRRVESHVAHWLSEIRGVTPADVVLGAWGYVAARVAGVPAIGVRFDGRRYQEFDSIVGTLGRDLPFALQVDRHESLVARAHRVAVLRGEMSVVQDCFSCSDAWHPSVPNHQRELPLGFVATEPALVMGGGTTITIEELCDFVDSHDVTLAFQTDASRRHRLSLQFNAACVAEADVLPLLDQVEAVLNGAARGPSRPMGIEAAKSATFHRRSDAKPSELSILNLVAAQVARVPQAPAVTNRGVQRTYSELWENAGAIAGWLCARGVMPSHRVMIDVHRRHGLLDAMFGAWRAGASVAMFDPEDPRKWAHDLSLELAPAAILTDRVEPRADLGAIPVLRVDLPVPRASAPAPREPGPNETAYVVYTSGSTGRPKGAAISHRSLSAYLTWAAVAYDLRCGDTAVVQTSLAADLTLTALLTPLTVGATVELLDEEPGFGALAARLSDSGHIALVKATPSQVEVLSGILSSQHPRSRVRTVVLGGEPLDGEHVRLCSELLSAGRVINEYGPTEATVGCTFFDATEWKSAGCAVPIGTAVPYAAVHVLDDDLQAVPTWVPGEVFVGGDGVAQHYIARSDLTADRFVPDPFAVELGARMYRTGDLARYRPDGALEFLGRRDSQIKIRGHRVEPGEIVATIRQHPGVDGAVVLPSKGRDGRMALIAYVVRRLPLSVAERDLLGFLSERLPAHMVPAIQVVERLPLTGSGKVDLVALERAERRTESVRPPRTLEEEILAGIFARVLGLSEVDPDDGFFVLGGDSIRAIQVVAAAKQRGLVLNLEQLFRCRTVRSIARELAWSDASQTSQQEPLPFSLLTDEEHRSLPEDAVDAYPLTALQAGMLFHVEAAPGTAIYHDVASYRLHDRFHEGAFRQAAARLFDRHPVLRSSIALGLFSRPLQIVHASVAPVVAVEDLRTLDATAATRVIRDWIYGEKERPFELAICPLVRFHVHLRSDDDVQLGVSFHHAVLDGWSDATMLTELFLDYAALRAGRSPPIEAPRCRFATFVALEAAAADSNEDQLFWDQCLAGVSIMRLPRWQLPQQAPEPRSVFSVPVQIPSEVSTALRSLATSLTLPLKSLLLAVHMRVLAFVVGNDDVVTCMSSSGRPELDDGDRVLGLFLNSLPIRMSVTANSWSALAEAALDVERRAMPHRRHPFASIRRRRGDDITEVAFYYTHYHVYDALRGSGGVEVRDFEVYEETSFALVANFGLSPITGQLRLQLTCDRGVITQDQATELASAYEVALAAAAQRPWSSPALCDLSVPVARQRALDHNLPGRSYPVRPLEELLETIAAHGSSVALIVGQVSATYGELWSRASAVSAAIREMGVGADRVVALAIPPGLDLVAAILGTLIAGRAYLPLEIKAPSERTRQMLVDADVALIVTCRSAREEYPVELARLYVEELPQTGDARPEFVPGACLAYVLFTSGSTGRPKGVQVTRGGLASYLQAAVRRYPLGLGRVPLLSSTAVDLSITSLLGTLVAGGTLLIASEDLPAESLLAAFTGDVEYGLVKLTPTQGRLVATLRRDAPIRCRAVVFGGEALRQEDIASWIRLAPGAELWNEYGPTETVVGCAAYRVDAELLDGQAVPIGRPFEACEAFVLDRSLNPVPTGTPGELYIAGDTLARGYASGAALTADRFVPHPYSSRSGDRMYRTGDIVCTSPEFGLIFIGRRDDQVKIRGHRVELGEIEAALRTCPNVTDAAVNIVPNSERALLWAYVVANGAIDEAAIIEQLARRLPEPMLPMAVTRVATIPRTAAGKLNRLALPRPDSTAPSKQYHPPRDPLEEVVGRIWAEALGVQRVGIHDTFGELGGHSIVAIQLIATIRRALLVDIPLRDLLDAPTIADLAQAIRRRGGSPSTAVIGRVAPDLAQQYEPFPLTDVQQAYWIGRASALELGSVGSHLYMEVEGDLDASRLEDALAQLIERHDMLRAIVLPEGKQVVLKDVPRYRVQVADLRGERVGEIERRLQTVRDEMSHHVLPTDRWPIFELRLCRLTETMARACVSMDALMADAWSMRLLARDLFRLYRGEALAAPARITFRDYVVGSTALADSELTRQSRAYWWARLDNFARAPELPLRTGDMTLWRKPRFVRVGGRVEATLWARLKRLAVHHGLTTTTVLIAAFSEALGLYVRQRRFALNLTLYNRLPVHPDVNEVVGDFTTLNLLEVDVRGSLGFVDRAREIQRQLWNDLDHRHVTGVEVLRELARRRRQPLRASMPVVFTSTLNLRELQGEDWVPRDLKTVFSLTQTPQVWLDHQVMEENGELLVNWDVVEGLFPEGLIDDLLQTYLSSVRHLCGEDDVWQADLGDWLATRVSERWGCSQASLDRVIPKRLESSLIERANDTPERDAVVAEDRRMTFATLLREADAIAARLQGVGVEPGDLVAVILPRGWRQLVAMAGVLRAGAAYLPIDTEWPGLRRDQLLKGSGVRRAIIDRSLSSAALPASLLSVDIDDNPLVHYREAKASPRDLAYVIYTSGSTGEPKGVRITHEAAWNTIDVVNRRWGVSERDSIVAVSASTFDLSVYDLFGMIAAGARVIVPSARRWRDPAHWADLIVREKVTIWNSVPTLMELLVEHAEARTDGALRSLRLVLLSGDWVPVGLPERIRRLAGPAVTVVALGGATEGAIWSIAHETNERDSKRPSIPYGRSLANQRIHVWDESLRERGVWATGDLYIAGAGVADGYHADAWRTAAQFVPHPRSSDRVYRTGDLGRYLPDGTIEFLGREDHQVKIGGYRIELGEIEASLVRCEGVAQAVVTARGVHGRPDRRLAAFVVPGIGVRPSAESLRQALRATLPPYMVPATLQIVEKLPVTANGKVDRAALGAPIEGLVPRAMTAPRNAVERRIARAWSDVLGIREVGIHDDFFDVGGNSLRAIQLLTRLRSALQVTLPLERLLTHPTIEQIAAAVEAALVERLEHMPEDEAAKLLASRRGHVREGH